MIGLHIDVIASLNLTFVVAFCTSTFCLILRHMTLFKVQLICTHPRLLKLNFVIASQIYLWPIYIYQPPSFTLAIN